MNPLEKRFIPRRCEGVAVVIILGFIVLITGLVVAFFSRTMTDRQLSNSSLCRAKADQLALSAVDIVIGDLKQEILLGSTASTINGVAVYRPRKPASSLPPYIFMQPGRDSSQTNATLNAIPNYIRCSPKASFALVMADGGKVGIGGGAAAVSSTVASINGRSISPARWNKHYLVPKADVTNSKTDPVTQFGKIVPYWIPITKTGPTASLAKPDKTVIGRYAFAIYDEGGLLDINVAGGPSSATDAQKGYKGSLSFADVITALSNATPSIRLSQTQLDNIVGWRNYASANAAGTFPQLTPAAQNYYDSIVSNTTGFLKTSGSQSLGRTDQAFLSRQQLIAFQQTAGLPAATLQYLTHFSRSLNAPSWAPLADFAAPYNYASSAASSGALNRDTLSVRAGATTAIAHYNDAGKTGAGIDYNVTKGQPLLQRRFSLARLNWLTPTGPLPGYEKAVHACFGLEWNVGSGLWTYTGSVGDTIQASIETLDQVASENREPNFFELLQAGILAGSLGVDGGGSVNFPSSHQGKTTLQILRIGACIIDQYDTDSCPTVIEYNESNAGIPYWQAVGVENLPYLNVFKDAVGFDGSSSLQTYLLWGLWNPQRTVASPSSTPKIRLHLKGSFAIVNGWGDYPITSSVIGSLPMVKCTLDDTCEIKNSADFSTPRLITANDVDISLGAQTFGWCVSPSFGGAQYMAYRVSDFKLNPSAVYPGSAPQPPWDIFRTYYSYDTNTPFQVSLEFQNPATNDWTPYQFATGINDSTTAQQGGVHWALNVTNLGAASKSPSSYADLINTLNNKFVFSASNRLNSSSSKLTCDPRSIRFNQWQLDLAYGLDSLWAPQPYGYGGGHSATSNTTSIARAYFSPAIALNGVSSGGVQEVPRIFNDPTLASKDEGSFYFPAWLSQNSKANNQSGCVSGYPDRDGVQRWADSGLSGGNPFGTAAERPVILNRPFQSVGELGYVFRDDPWRTLDFFTANSADAALLDLFSLRDEGPLSAGKVNLNSRIAPCLQAAIAGVVQEPVSSTPMLAADAKTLAQNLTAFTSVTTGTIKGPLLNASQLATAFLAVTGTTGTTATPKIKTTREAVIRGLGGVGQTRTWNLLVDVIAQSGQYGAAAISAGDLSKFTVESERRYWAHIAIDRFTGEVVDMQLEPVNE